MIRFLLPNDPGSATRRFFFSAAFWMLMGILFGVIAAVEMIAPDIMPAFPHYTFGRLRPVHINIVVFGFLLSAFFGGLLYVIPTICRTTLFSERLANFAVWFWNASILYITFALAHGITQGREYAEAPWIADMAVLAAVAIMIILTFGTIARREEKLLYVSAWYIGGGLLWTFFVYAVGNVVWEYPAGSWKGMNDQILLWFYGHNVVGLVITPQALGLAYFIIPRATRTPLYSHTLSLLGFWALIIMYTQTGTHHLLQAPVPQWLKVIAVINSISLLIPVFAFLINIWVPIKDRFGRVYDDVGAKMVFTGSIWYFITCIQGPFQSLPSVQRVTHFTQWVIAHSHIALLGFAGFIAAGAVYYILPIVMKRPLYSKLWADIQYWLMLIGTIGIFTSLTFAGLIQGEGWLNGETVYRILPELNIYFMVRGISGVLLLIAACIFVVNVMGTILVKAKEPAKDVATSSMDSSEVAA